ncbi:methyltransferase 11 domain-containing protein [Abeliophyllum distichum]|uniref:Methyltransferase 11 domain-containing protein n=1 Tax=Abeliophyllum distichum TaxID=126358 RepID=A0ABD1QT56_9LAMI
MDQGSLRNILVRLFLLCVSVITLRFAIVVTLRGESCDLGDFCFFSLPENLDVVTGVGKLTKSSSAIIATAAKLAPKKLPDCLGYRGFPEGGAFLLLNISRFDLRWIFEPPIEGSLFGNASRAGCFCVERDWHSGLYWDFQEIFQAIGHFRPGL